MTQLFAWEKYSLSTEQINTIWAPHDKTNKLTVCPAKTQISLGIRPVWSVFAVRMKKAWVLSYPLGAQRRLIRLPSLIRVLDGCTCHFVGFLPRWLILWFCFKTTLYSPLITPRTVTFYDVIWRRTRKIELDYRMHRHSSYHVFLKILNAAFGQCHFMDMPQGMSIKMTLSKCSYIVILVV